MSLAIIEHKKSPCNTKLLSDFVDFVRERLNIEVKNELNIVVVSDEEIKDLNSKYRNKDNPTDILSFYGYDGDILGDIVVSVDTIRRNAEKEKRNLNEYFLFIIAHGILHLLGYTHETMEKFEEMINIQNRLVEDFLSIGR